MNFAAVHHSGSECNDMFLYIQISLQNMKLNFNNAEEFYEAEVITYFSLYHKRISVCDKLWTFFCYTFHNWSRNMGITGKKSTGGVRKFCKTIASLFLY
jgi:hypothetical protein